MAAIRNVHPTLHKNYSTMGNFSIRDRVLPSK